MLSRAHLLIERDHEEILSESAWGIEAQPLTNDNIFEWSATIHGLQDSLWEGGIFRLYIKFDENYNYRPPELCFHTIPFHPNVDAITGRPSLDFLDDWNLWRQSYTTKFILTSIQSLLSNPILETAVNKEAADMILFAPHSYKQIVYECVAASQQVNSGNQIFPIIKEKTFLVKPTKNDTAELSKTETLNNVKKLQFDEYHNIWKGIATSKPRDCLRSTNPLHALIKDNPMLQSVHYGIPADELENQLERQLEEHSNLVYGKFKSKSKDLDKKNSKLDQINNMKKMYLRPRSAKESCSTPNLSHSKQITLSDEEDLDQQMNELVNWSNKLDIRDI